MTDLEVELFIVLHIIVAEFDSDPTSVQCFDPRVVERARKVVGENREEWVRARMKSVQTEEGEEGPCWPY